MNKRIFRIFLLWQHEEEEKWLNQMATEGWNMVATTGFSYLFEQSDTEAFTYRLEYLEERPGNMVNKPYFDFLADSKIQVVDTFRNWVYLRRPRELGPFDLFSDLDSRIGHYERIKKAFQIPLAILAAMVVISFWDYLISGDPPTIAALVAILAALGWGYHSLTSTIASLKKKRELNE